MSIRERVKAVSGKRTYKTEEIPSIGSVRVRSLFESEWQAGVSKWFRDEEFKLIPERAKYDRVKTVQMCLVEDDDSLSFTDSIEDLDSLVSLGADVIDGLWKLADSVTRSPKN